MNAKNCYGNVEVNQASKLLITSWDRWSIGKTLRGEIKQICVRARELVWISLYFLSCVFLSDLIFLHCHPFFCNLLTESFSLSAYNPLHTVFCPWPAPAELNMTLEMLQWKNHTHLQLCKGHSVKSLEINISSSPVHALIQSSAR